ncbi:hypothetical protein RDI58_022220 [Solanum bulbocastanum]|uniref:RNase H type-1 domain-containing protein n=2 Tax=Solanum bulbocastanum TaxID=147425 RepID=A0AAN8TA60_SOLBU
MAREPPVGTVRPPDQAQQERLNQTNKTHHQPPSNSSYNSVNLRNNEAMNSANSRREIEGKQKIIPPVRDSLNRAKMVEGNDYTSQDLQHTKKSRDSISLFERSGEAISGRIVEKSPEIRLQIRAHSHHFQGELNTRDYSPGEEVQKSYPDLLTGCITTQTTMVSSWKRETINSGSCNFWWDNWLGVGPLAGFTNDSKMFNNTKVAEYLMNGQWNYDKLRQQAPPCQLANILATDLHYQQDTPDQAIWNLNNDGQFTCSSAWNVIRDKRNKSKFNSFIWHKNIPFKASFLLWRALRGKLPTNEKLTKFGNEPTKCFCCNRSGMDTIEHIFNNGHFATYVWKSYSETAGITTDHSSLPQLIRQWWSTKPKNEAHRMLIQATPIFICWNLWKNRCASKWPSNWKDLIAMGENCIHDTKVTLVMWRRPPKNWVKLNTDGSALDNPGKLGAGGIIRDHRGEIILAFSTPMGEGTNNQAEIGAAIFGMTWLIQLGYRNVLLEVDSQLLVDWIMAKTKPPWSVNTQVQQMSTLIGQTSNFRCKHTYREANSVADSLAKHSHKITSPNIYTNSQQLPKEARAHYQLDVLEMANFRRRKIKRIKEPP